MKKTIVKNELQLVITISIFLCGIALLPNNSFATIQTIENASIPIQQISNREDQITIQNDEHFLGLTTEKYSSSVWEEHGYTALTTYRVYAHVDMTTFYCAVYGGYNDTLHVYSTSGVFYNDLTYPSIGPPEDHTQPPDNYYANLWDTYLTIDCDIDCGDHPNFAPSREAFAQLTNDLAGDFILSGENIGTWYGFLGSWDPPLKILIAQFTVAEGERIGGYLNIQTDWGIYCDVPFGLELADVNGDTYIDVLDLLEILAHFGEPGGPADLNNDSIVDIQDILILFQNWT